MLCLPGCLHLCRGHRYWSQLASLNPGRFRRIQHLRNPIGAWDPVQRSGWSRLRPLAVEWIEDTAREHWDRLSGKQMSPGLFLAVVYSGANSEHQTDSSQHPWVWRGEWKGIHQLLSMERREEREGISRVLKPLNSSLFQVPPEIFVWFKSLFCFGFPFSLWFSFSISFGSD